MSFHNGFPLGLDQRPLVFTPFVQQNDIGLVTPGGSEFIVTENEIKISAENGQLLITED